MAQQPPQATGLEEGRSSPQEKADQQVDVHFTKEPGFRDPILSLCWIEAKPCLVWQRSAWTTGSANCPTPGWRMQYLPRDGP